MGIEMALYIISGNYTQSALKGMLARPSDREAAARTLIESAGGALQSFHLTTGDSDFTMTVRSDNLPRTLSALMVAGAAGAIANPRTVQAFTSAEFLAMQKQAGDFAQAYQAPT